MEITLTDEQEFFRDTTRKFLGSESSVPKVRALHSSPAGFERAYWRQGAELGWVSMLVPEALGGGNVSGSGPSDLALVAHSFGSHAAPGPLIPCNVVAVALARSGNEQQQAETLPALVAGEQIATWASTEMPPHDALGAPLMRAESDGEGYVLSGVKSPVEAGAESDHLLVTAQTDAGLTQFLVPVHADGLTITPLRSVDLTRRYARIEFAGVRVGADALVGAPGAAAGDVEQQLRVAAVLQSAEMVGAADTLFAMTLEWAFDRYSFGRPLASYQEIKHRFADLKLWLETSHALGDHAARLVSADAPDAGLVSSAAKAYAGDHLAELAQDTVQLHGGIGVTYESDVHLYLRRITADRLTYGTPTDHRRRIGARAAPSTPRDRASPEDAMTDTDPDLEPVESFRARARAWLHDNYPRVEDEPRERNHAEMTDEEEAASIARARELQRHLYDGGLAGVCFPKEYGGLGLTPEHQRVLNEEVVGYATPRVLQVPTFTPCAAVLLEFGTEEQKQRHLPAILKGEEIWSQFLSEPSGGSDVAGVLTTAVRDGDEWVINGSKIWTSGGYASDYGLTLVRTNWDVPKHRGLSVFIVKTHQPDVEVHRIEMINGSREFCQEFFTDVRVPDGDRVGDVDQGWTVGTRWMFHEKDALGGASQYVTGSIFAGGVAEPDARLVELARAAGRIDDPVALDLIGDAYTLVQARRALGQRLVVGTRTGALPDSSAALARLMSAVVHIRMDDIGIDLAGPNAVATLPDDPWADDAFSYLERQATAIGGGTVEMARNNIAERVLGMPRELTHDKNLPFRDVPKGPTAS